MASGQMIAGTVKRLPNGVRARQVGREDPWVEAHREAGREFYCCDVDGILGLSALGVTSEDRLHVEYEPDPWSQRASEDGSPNLMREFGIVALFERKTSPAAVQMGGASLALALYLWMCRTLAKLQPFPPRLFLVVGPTEGPWHMQELDIHTGEHTGPRIVLRRSTWRAIWEEIGLVGLRDRLRQWLKGQYNDGQP